MQPFVSSHLFFTTIIAPQLYTLSLHDALPIFDGEGITESYRTISNDDGMAKLKTMLTKDFIGLCFLNLVDFDADRKSTRLNSSHVAISYAVLCLKKKRRVLINDFM